MINSSQSFWADAPVLSWVETFKRFFLKPTVKPSLLPDSPKMSTSIKTPCIATGTTPSPLIPESAREYSLFLETWFYPLQMPTRLRIPIGMLFSYLKIKQWFGVELRTREGILIGLVIAKFAGSLNSIPVASIAWLCIHPSWRKKGLTNSLLRTIYATYYNSVKVYLFRKEGSPVSIPPILQQHIYMRYPRRGHNHVCVNVLYDFIKRPENSEIWSLERSSSQIEYKESFVIQYKSKETIYNIRLQSTYEELYMQSGNASVEILDWWSTGKPTSENEEKYIYESMIDSLSYRAVYAPKGLPRLDSMGWVYSGTQTWYGFHLDPGHPFPLRITTPVGF